MQTYEETLEARSGCNDEAVPCANCGHLDVEHDPETLWCLHRLTCNCRRFEPISIEDEELDEVL